MAIKKRNPTDRDALAEQFAAGAETSPAPAAKSTPRSSARPAAGTGAPVDVDGEPFPKQMQIRFADDERLQRMIAEISAREERSKHFVALRALTRGVEERHAELFGS